MNKIILHMEGFAVLALSVYFYASGHFSWTLFFILLFAPDLSMIGYLANPSTGALIYNIFHTYCLPAVLLAFGLMLPSETALALSLIWFTHIGMDRTLGYGLKYPGDFKDTHLNRL